MTSALLRDPYHLLDPPPPGWPWYDRDGEAITAELHGHLLQDRSYCVLALTTLPGVGTLSTVWTGSATHLDGRGLFETAFCEPDGTIHEVATYATRQEAALAHARVVGVLTLPNVRQAVLGLLYPPATAATAAVD